MEKYYVVRVGSDDDEKFYVSRKHFSFKLHEAACFVDSPEGLELAETIAQRYNGFVSTEHGYDVHYSYNLADLGERSAKSLLAEAVKICRREGWSLPTVQVQVEQFYDSATVKAA